MRIRSQGNKQGGLLFMIFGTIGIIGIVLIAVMTTLFIPSGSVNIWIFLPFHIFAACVMLIPITFGTVMFVRAVKAEKATKGGRKTCCQVYNVLRMKNGYQMIVTYVGESGQDYKLGVDISYSDAAMIKPEMWVECYINGEDCYIDNRHIVIVDDPAFVE